VDLVGVLELPRLHREAQGLQLRRNGPLGHVSIAWLTPAPID
jgi:hypothetical protein